MTFQPAFMEHLYEVYSKNSFFIYSFVYPEIAFRSCDNKTHTSAVYVDISSLIEQRLNIVLSICPPDYNPEHINSFVIKYPLYGLCVELIEDNVSFNLSQLYKENDCVKVRPHLDKLGEQYITKEQAFLSYSHALYQTNEAIVFPPNGEGILKIIFSVEMRIPPWLHIEFANPDYSAEVVVRKTTYLTFKVINKTHNQYIKRAEDIKITQLILDANIYEDDSVAPPNCI